MFLPQRPYVPNGPLRQALAYPEDAAKYSDAELRQALADALLPDLAARLDDSDAWSQKLSGGEQQRLAIARVLLKKPRWIFADEISSALDGPSRAHAVSAAFGDGAQAETAPWSPLRTAQPWASSTPSAGHWCLKQRAPPRAIAWR